MSTMQTTVDTRPVLRSGNAVLIAVLIAGFVLRLLFINNEGFHNDVASFEGWALTLSEHPMREFYAKAGFADYPPGYFYVLWVLGHIYQLFRNVDPAFVLLKYLVKLPAILVDLADGILIYAIVRRFADFRWALGAAAFFVLNPAVIFISAAWGQIDSIAGGLALLGAYLMLRSDDEDQRRATLFIVCAWLALAYSILIKPPAAILVPLFIAFAFADPLRRGLRLRAAGYGILAAFALAWILSLPFHPVANPIAVFAWLLQRYEFGTGVYAFNSINAFNLWTIRYSFWQSDHDVVLLFPQYVWGIVLLLAASVLVLMRYLQAPTQRAFLESCALLTLAFFMLSTRMHERYVFDGLLFTIPLIAFARRYLVAATVLSITLFTNLVYSLHYMVVMEQHLPADATNLMPLLSRPMSLANVAVFFALGYVFLGSNEETDAARAQTAAAPAGLAEQSEYLHARSWFDPREGIAALRWPLDHAIAALLGIASFVLSYIGYAGVREKVFDEIYFARAAEEYLKHVYIYENTHPPLTKLLISLSVMLFGGLAHGDNAAGWRFLDVVFGALTISLLFVFAKRITRSTLFAAIAASLLLFDGMHFVQSRIATPESFVAFFALATIYTFYRYWIAAQVRTSQEVDDVQLRNRLIGIGACLLVAIVGVLWRFSGETGGTITVFPVTLPTVFVGKVLAIGYVFCGLYLVFRGLILPRFVHSARAFTSYADGTAVKYDSRGQALYAPDGGIIDSAQRPVAGDLSVAERGTLVLQDEDLISTYRKDGSLEYATPLSTARFTKGHAATIDGEPVEFGSPRVWLTLFAIAITCLVTSKWYGVMTYPATVGIIALVWLQPHIGTVLKEFGKKRRPARWGNPFGFPLDVVFATLVFIGGTIYFATYVPQMMGVQDTPGAKPHYWTYTEVIQQQKGMYDYHHNLVATHPYESKWWQWPLDLRPIAYYWKDSRRPGHANDEKACCVAEITSLPNPLILWFGLFSVLYAGYLGYRERNKGYMLLFIAYMFQWLPWIGSPRISFAYHFYVNIAIICLCNAIALQRLWVWGTASGEESRWISRAVTFGYVAAVIAAFIFFYPLLAGVPLPWDQWNARTLPWLMHSGWI